MRGQPSPTSDVVLNARLRQIQGTLEGESTEDRSITSALVGALLLSRSVENPKLARQILDVTRILLNQARI